MAVVKVKRTRKRTPVRKPGGKVRVKKVRRDTLKNKASNNIRISVQPGVVTAGGSSSSALAGGSSGFSYPQTAGVVDNTTGNELKQLRQDVALNFQSLLGDLANTRELDREFRRAVGHVEAQPTARTVLTRETGVQGDVVVPMDVAAADMLQPNAIADPMNQGPVDGAAVAPVAAVGIGGGGGEPLVQPPLPPGERMQVVGRREAAREDRNRAQRLAAEAAAAAVRANGLQPAPFGPPAQGLEGRVGDNMQGMGGVINNTRLPKRRPGDPPGPLGQGNELVLNQRAEAERGYVDRITNRQDFPLYRNTVAGGGVALPIYEGQARSDRRPKSMRFNPVGQDPVLDALPPQQQEELLQLQYEQDGNDGL
jgi:hypothetical protein